MNTTSNEMKLTTTRNFGELAVEVYENQQKEFFMTRDQIGTALEYGDPFRNISKIHDRNKDRLDPQSSVVNLTTEVGNHTQTRQVYMYTLRGVMEICRFSRQPKADAFMDFCWDVMESLMRGETVSLKQSDVEVKRQARFDLMTDNLVKIQEQQNELIGKLNALNEFRKQDRQAIDNVLFVCKQLSQRLQSTQPGSFTPRKNPKGQSEWRTELYDIVYKIARVSGETVNSIMSWGYKFLGTNYGWYFKEARREYIDKFEYKGDVKSLTGIDIIESSEMYKSIFMAIMKDKLEEEKHDAECKKGIVSSLVKSKCPAPIPKEVIPQRHPIEEKPEEKPIEIVAELQAVEVHKPKNKYKPSPIKVIVEPIAERLGDKTVGYWLTCRKIYEIIGVSTMSRLTKQYRVNHNGHDPKNKTALFICSEKNMKLFKKAADELAGQI